MTKRRAEQVLLHDVPNKRRLFSRGSFDTHLESMTAAVGVSPPSLLALLGSRCRKRPFCFGDEEESREKVQPSKIKASDYPVCAADGPLTSFQDKTCNVNIPLAKQTASKANSNKRAREDSGTSKGASLKIVTHKHENGEGGNDFSTFNSFQYWRVPLPELDLSLIQTENLENTKKCTPAKDVFSDAMET